MLLLFHCNDTFSLFSSVPNRQHRHTQNKCRFFFQGARTLLSFSAALVLRTRWYQLLTTQQHIFRARNVCSLTVASALFANTNKQTNRSKYRYMMCPSFVGTSCVTHVIFHPTYCGRCLICMLLWGPRAHQPHSSDEIDRSAPTPFRKPSSHFLLLHSVFHITVFAIVVTIGPVITIATVWVSRFVSM